MNLNLKKIEGGNDEEEDSDAGTDAGSEDSMAGYNFDDEPEDIKEAVNRLTSSITQSLRNMPVRLSSSEEEDDE